jgi:hypothetical protein
VVPIVPQRRAGRHTACITAHSLRRCSVTCSPLASPLALCVLAWDSNPPVGHGGFQTARGYRQTTAAVVGCEARRACRLFRRALRSSGPAHAVVSLPSAWLSHGAPTACSCVRVGMWVCYVYTGLGITKTGSLVMLFHDVTDVKSGGEHAVDMLRNTLRQQTPYTLKHQSRTLLHVTLWRCFSNHALTGAAQPTLPARKKSTSLRKSVVRLSRVGRAVSALVLWHRKPSAMRAAQTVEILSRPYNAS